MSQHTRLSIKKSFVAKNNHVLLFNNKLNKCNESTARNQ